MVKFLSISLGVMIVLLVALGAPTTGRLAQRDTYYGGTMAVLPMTFAHRDHVATKCVVCHHNFNDDTGAGLCINCHVTDTDVMGRLEEQFHDLCRSCHVEKHVQDEPSGPTRQCDGCHLPDRLP
ncbi:MAG: cytochrome c3 family protein [Pseudomonadota bacterium]